MKVHLLRVSPAPAPSAVDTLVELSRRSGTHRHELVDDPGEADALLVVDAHLLGPDWRLSAVGAHPLVRRFPEKVFVYDERDRPWCRFPGLYASMPSTHFRREWQRASSYLPIGMNLLDEGERGRERTLLYSFVGSMSHRCREPLFALEDDRSEISRVRGFAFYDSNSVDFEVRRLHFRDVIARSSFVLCPRGVGTSSIRLYETIAAGRVPVIISDHWVPPGGPDWSTFSVRWPEGTTQGLREHLEDREAEAGTMGDRAREAFDGYFGEDVIFNRLMDHIEDLLPGRSRFPERGVRDTRMVQVGAQVNTVRLRSQLGRTRSALISGRSASGPPQSSDVVSSFPHVAIAASSFAPHKGGVEELVRQLAHQQERDGGSPVVLTMRWPKDLARAEVIEGLPVRRFLYRTPEGNLRRRMIARLTMPLTIAGVARELRRRKVDLVHVQCVSSAAWFVARAARRVGLPLVVTLQGELTMDADGVYQRSEFVRSTLRDLLATADAVTACSQHTLTEAEEWAGLLLGERGSVVHNGVVVAEFAEAEAEARGRPYVLAIGRHVREKGFDVLLDAFALLRDRPGFEWQLVLAGDGQEHAALHTRVEQLGLTDRVDLIGATDRGRTASLFRGCSLFVLPSRHEPFGIVNLEAMAAGAPVVATAVGGVPEFVVDGHSGLLVTPEDPSALAEAIARVHDDPALAAALSAQGRLQAAAHDWSEIDLRYREVYRAVLERSR